MKKFLVGIIFLVTLSMVMSLEDESVQIKKILNSFMDSTPKELFKVWHLLYKREYTYASEEAKMRFRNFKINLALIKETNSKHLGYTFGLNQFSDLSAEEFKRIYLTRKPNLNLEQDLKEINNQLGFLTPTDDDDDLTKRNLQMANIDYSMYFLPPRDQGGCGSCWAFSSAGAIEGNLSKKKGAPVNYLSTQQLVDCDTGNGGCNGGDMRVCYKYVMLSGMMNDIDYKYTAAKGSCKYVKTQAVSKILGFDYCSGYTSRTCSTSIFYSLLAKGPLAVGIDGSTIQSYYNGIYLGACYQDNHAVIAIGYGTSGAQNYWIVRNSWGASWGENGYIRVLANINNNSSCFVENEGVLPLV